MDFCSVMVYRWRETQLADSFMEERSLYTFLVFDFKNAERITNSSDIINMHDTDDDSM